MRKASCVVIGCLAIATVGCKQKSQTAPSMDAAVASPATPPGQKTVPVPPEPTPMADKAAEVPSLEAKLAADHAFVAAWGPDHVAERNTLLTAISDLLAAGVLHTDIEADMKKAQLMDALAVINGILRRTGTLGPETTKKIEAHLTANRTAPRLGLWNQDEKGAQLVDATAVAMWLHPNDPTYVRERLRAMTKGQFISRDGQPVARAWLARTADVINRLAGLGAFGKDDCTALNARWTEKVLPNGETQFGCEPAEAGAEAAANTSVVGAWDQVITNPSTPNSYASDVMRHVFRDDGTVAVRMDESKTQTFKWKTENGKITVAYKYGEYDHTREFRLRSANEAEVVEDGRVLDTYIREGSPIAQQKKAVAIYAEVAAVKNRLDVTKLAVGKAYVLDRETPLAPELDPADPTAAIARIKKIPAGSTFTILGKKATATGNVQYQVKTTASGDVGWFSSIALLGQNIQAK